MKLEMKWDTIKPQVGQELRKMSFLASFPQLGPIGEVYVWTGPIREDTAIDKRILNQWAKLSKDSDAMLWICRRNTSRIARLPAQCAVSRQSFCFFRERSWYF